MDAGTSPKPASKPLPAPSALPPMQHPADNPTSAAKVALGKQLFVDTRLSGSGKMACQSCHYRHLGWTDAQVQQFRSSLRPSGWLVEHANGVLTVTRARALDLGS